jgi:multidrug resistance efflux pump
MFSRIFSYLRALPASVVGYAKRRPRTILVGVAVVVVLIGLYAMFGGGKTAVAPTNEALVPQVSVATLGALQVNGKPVVLLGEVRSVSQAELRAQKSGEVTGVNVRAGQFVGAGTVLVTIENAGERAAVLQAQGAVAAAEAGLARINNGARAEDRASAGAGAASAKVSLAQAKENAQSAYTSAFSAVQDAVLAKSDTFFTNPYTVAPSFRVSSATFDERRALESERAAIGTMLDAWKTEAGTPLAESALDSNLGQAQDRLDRVKRFLDRVAYFVSKQEVTADRTSATIAGQNALILAARQGIDGARASVSGARTGLAGAKSANTVASLSQSKLTVGERPEDVQAAQAGVTSARGILAGATAALEKSLIRSPISGTVTSLSVGQGDFASNGQNMAVVANEGAREIVAFVSEDVRNTIAPGMKVLVDGQYDGVITSADPGLDPNTKLARVTVGVPKDVALTNGSFVEVAVSQDTATTTTKVTKPKQTGWYIPVAAIKVLPTGLALFTVADDGTLKAQEIHEGTIVGDRMLIQDKLSAELRIVTDVRGRIEGEKVTIGK